MREASPGGTAALSGHWLDAVDNDAEATPIRAVPSAAPSSGHSALYRALTRSSATLRGSATRTGGSRSVVLSSTVALSEGGDLSEGDLLVGKGASSQTTLLLAELRVPPSLSERPTMIPATKRTPPAQNSRDVRSPELVGRFSRRLIKPITQYHTVLYVRVLVCSSYCVVCCGSMFDVGLLAPLL